MKSPGKNPVDTPGGKTIKDLSASGLDVLINDLIWISKRFSGILQLSEYLQDYTTLRNHVVELENSKLKLLDEISQLKKSINDDLEDFKNRVAVAQDKIKQSKEQSFEIIRQAEVEAQNIRVKADKEAEKIIESAKTKADHIDNLIAERKYYLQNLEQQISNLENKHKSLIESINKLKSQLG